MTVDLSDDADAKNIRAELAAITDYGNYGTGDAVTGSVVKPGAFKVMLYNGANTSATGTSGTTDLPYT